jgi:hypothetical protein
VRARFEQIFPSKQVGQIHRAGISLKQDGLVLCHLSLIGRKSLIDDVPKGYDGLPLFIEEVFKEAWLVEWRWICISLAIGSELSNPINRFLGINHCEQSTWI